MELLLGCGNNRDKKFYQIGKEKWDDLITLDIDPSCKPDVVHDLNSIPLPFRDNTFDEIHSYDNIEHYGGPQGNWRAFFDHFSDLWRILKPNGLFFCSTPHRDSVWAIGDPGHVRIVPPESVGFLDQDTYSQVGQTPLTDYRPYYKADFKAVFADVTPEKQFNFILQAKKP